jgi:hypothetical protein
MATPSRIRTLATAKPFRPYRVRLAGGHTDLIDPPENAACALEGHGTEPVVFDDEGMHRLDMTLVEALEPVSARAAVPENH